MIMTFIGSETELRSRLDLASEDLSAHVTVSREVSIEGVFREVKMKK